MDKIIMTDCYKIGIGSSFVQEKVLTMKHHNICKFEFDYPFHANYRGNRNAVKSIFSEFWVIAQEELVEAPVINIVCRGSSGCFTAAIFYECLVEKTELEFKDIRVVYLRKSEELSHGGNGVYGKSDDNRALWLWVDDFIDSGETLRACRHKIGDGGEFKFDWAICAHSYSSGFKSADKCTKNLVCNYE